MLHLTVPIFAVDTSPPSPWMDDPYLCGGEIKSARLLVKDDEAQLSTAIVKESVSKVILSGGALSCAVKQVLEVADLLSRRRCRLVRRGYIGLMIRFEFPFGGVELPCVLWRCVIRVRLEV